MGNINWADFGTAGLIAAFVIVIIYKLPDIITSIKNKSDNTSELKKSVDNNTAVIEKLANYLDKQDAVREEQDKQYYKEMSDIKGNTEKLIEVMNKHVVQCENCYRR